MKFLLFFVEAFQKVVLRTFGLIARHGVQRHSVDAAENAVFDVGILTLHQLDGWFTNGEQLLETAQILDAPFFSTYASALETIQGVFQPSGTDYIIHALGDRQRQDYLDTFRTGDYPYAVTIRKEYNLWEWWIQRANWDFYRELFSGYVPVHTSDYALIWQRQEDSGAVLDSQDVTP